MISKSQEVVQNSAVRREFEWHEAASALELKANRIEVIMNAGRRNRSTLHIEVKRSSD